MLIRKAVITTASLFKRIISVRLLMKLTGKNVIFPFYHSVSDSSLTHIHHLYHPKTTKQFISDLDFLLKHYCPMDINEVISFRDSNKKQSKPGFFLSFDDGLKEFYEIIAPVLLKKGIPAMRGQGIEVVSREMVAFEWLHQSGTAEFNEISANFLR